MNFCCCLFWNLIIDFDSNDGYIFCCLIWKLNFDLDNGRHDDRSFHHTMNILDHKYKKIGYKKKCNFAILENLKFQKFSKKMCFTPYGFKERPFRHQNVHFRYFLFWPQKWNRDRKEKLILLRQKTSGIEQIPNKIEFLLISKMAISKLSISKLSIPKCHYVVLLFVFKQPLTLVIKKAIQLWPSKQKSRMWTRKLKLDINNFEKKRETRNKMIWKITYFLLPSLTFQLSMTQQKSINTFTRCDQKKKNLWSLTFS